MNISVYFRIISTHITMDILDILDILDVLTTSPVTNFSAFGSKNSIPNQVWS